VAQVLKYIKASLFAAVWPSLFYGGCWGIYALNDSVSSVDSAFQFSVIIFGFSTLIIFLTSISYGVISHLILKKIEKANYVSMATTGILGSLFIIYCFSLSHENLYLISAVMLGISASIIFFRIVKTNTIEK